MELPEFSFRGEDSALIHISVWNSDEMTGVLAVTLDYEEKTFFFKNQDRAWKKPGFPAAAADLSPGHSFSGLINMRK